MIPNIDKQVFCICIANKSNLLIDLSLVEGDIVEMDGIADKRYS